MDLVPTDAEVVEAERIYKTAYDADFGRGYGMRRALESFLQGRAKLAQETSIGNIQIIADPSIPKGEAVFKQDGKEVGRITNIADAQEPAQENNECAANGSQGCRITASGPHGERQCEYCGKPAQEEITDAESKKWLLRSAKAEALLRRVHRLMPVFEKGVGQLTFTAETGGEIYAEMRAIQLELSGHTEESWTEAAIRASKGEKT